MQSVNRNLQQKKIKSKKHLQFLVGCDRISGRAKKCAQERSAMMQEVAARDERVCAFFFCAGGKFLRSMSDYQTGRNQSAFAALCCGLGQGRVFLQAQFLNKRNLSGYALWRICAPGSVMVPGFSSGNRGTPGSV
jgi:hypothetical protein